MNGTGAYFCQDSHGVWRQQVAQKQIVSLFKPSQLLQRSFYHFYLLAPRLPLHSLMALPSPPVGLMSLPEECIVLIFSHVTNVLHFQLTCKLFNHVAKDTQARALHLLTTARPADHNCYTDLWVNLFQKPNWCGDTDLIEQLIRRRVGPRCNFSLITALQMAFQLASPESRDGKIIIQARVGSKLRNVTNEQCTMIAYLALPDSPMDFESLLHHDSMIGVSIQTRAWHTIRALQASSDAFVLFGLQSHIRRPENTGTCTYGSRESRVLP